MSSLRRRGISIVGAVLITWVVGVPSASAGLVEKVVDTANSVVETTTSSLPNVVPPVTGPAPAAPQGVPQVPVDPAPGDPREATTTPSPSSHSAPAPSGGATEVGSPGPAPPATQPATNGGPHGVGFLASAPREVVGADRPARAASGPGTRQRDDVARDPVEAAGPQRGAARAWPAVAAARDSAAPTDAPEPPSFDPVSIGGGMGLLLTMVTSLLALVGVVALARLVKGEELFSPPRWRH